MAYAERGECAILGLAGALILGLAATSMADDPPADKKLPPDDAVRNTLETLTMDLNFSDVPVGDLLAFLSEFAGLNIVLDRRIAGVDDRPATVKMVDATGKVALENALKQAKLDYRIRWGVVFVSESARLEKLPDSASWCAIPADTEPAEKEKLAKLGEKPVSLDCTELGLPAFATYLNDVAGLAAAAEGEGAEACAITIRLEGIPLRDALTIISLLYDIQVRLEGDWVHLVAPAADGKPEGGGESPK